MSDASDASERQSTEEEPSDAFDRRLMENTSAHAIFTLDDGGHVTSWSAPAATLYGHEAEAILEDSVRVLLADDENENEDTPLEDFFEGVATGPAEFEQWHQRADGDVFWATLTLSPLADEDGTNYVAVSRDTTAAKEYEQMLERQNDRLKEFTDILAHDLRNPLNVIDGRLELYEETGDEAHLETIHETTSRMERLVDDLLRVARQGVVVANPEATDIGTVIETAWGGGNREDDGRDPRLRGRADGERRLGPARRTVREPLPERRRTRFDEPWLANSPGRRGAWLHEQSARGR
jgi:PAS domain S-box-containing protein